MQEQRNAVVFGAGGFIGRHLVARLAREGFWVRAVVRDAARFLGIAHDVVEGDLTCPATAARALRDRRIDHAYLLAADMGGALYVNTKAKDADIMSNSVLINVNVLSACVEHRVGRVFFASSACVYPVPPSGGAVACLEDDAYPASPENGYGWVKIFTEQLLLSHGQQHGLSVRIARLHSIVGENSRWNDGKEKAHSALARKVALVRGAEDVVEVVGDGTQVRTFLHVDDCIDAILLMMESDSPELEGVPVNVGSDEALTINDYVELLRAVSGKQFRVAHVDAPEAVGVRERLCPVGRAERLLGWRPRVGVEESTRRVYEWIAGQVQALRAE